MMKTGSEALEVLIGEQLSSVEFVQDYVQLRFDGPCLNAYSPPMVRQDDKILKWGEAGYRDMLCERIGKIVRATSDVENDKICIEFEDDSSVMIPLYCSELPEIASFHVGTAIWVWQAD